MEEQALDESERWTWLLSQDEMQGDRTAWVLQRYPDLAAGSHADAQRKLLAFGEYQGHVPEAGRDLAPTRAEAKPLSASALELAGKCPLAFFFRNGLGLYALDEREIDLDRWLESWDFGSLLHEVFRQFLHQLAHVELRPNYERDHHRLAEILTREIERYRKEVPPPNENAYRVQCWQLLEVANTFLKAEELHCQTHRPRHFEVSLGLEPVGEGTPLDDVQPVQVPLADGRAIKAKGQIDRVDELNSGGLSLWDYKTGSAWGFSAGDPFRQGRRVQNVLYPAMIRQVLAQRQLPGSIEAFGYFFPGIKAGGTRIAWTEEELAPGLQILTTMCHMIERGAFAATDQKDDCTFCDYRACCGDIKQVTRHSGTLLDELPIVELTELRGLRRDK